MAVFVSWDGIDVCGVFVRQRERTLLFILGLGALGFYQSNRLFLNAKRDLSNLGSPVQPLLMPATLSAGDPVALYVYNRPFAEQQANIDRKFDRVQQAGYLLAGVYLWNLMDVWFFSGSATAALSGQKSSRSQNTANYRWSIVPVVRPERGEKEQMKAAGFYSNNSSVQSRAYRQEIYFTKSIYF